MICIKCGEENLDSANFCNHCGADLKKNEISQENTIWTTMLDKLLYIKMGIIILTSLLIFAFSFGSIVKLNVLAYSEGMNSELVHFDIEQKSTNLYEALYKVLKMSELEILEEFSKEVDAESAEYEEINSDVMSELYSKVNLLMALYAELGSTETGIEYGFLIFEVILLFIIQAAPLAIIIFVVVNVLVKKKTGISHNLLLGTGLIALVLSKMMLNNFDIKFSTGTGLVLYIWFAMAGFIIIKIIDMIASRYTLKSDVNILKSKKNIAYISSVLLGFVILIIMSLSYITGTYEYPSSDKVSGSISLQETSVFLLINEEGSEFMVAGNLIYEYYLFEASTLESEMQVLADTFQWENVFNYKLLESKLFQGDILLGTAFLAMGLLLITVSYQGLILFDDKYKYKKTRFTIQIIQITFGLLLTGLAIALVLIVNSTLGKVESNAIYSLGLGIIFVNILLITQFVLNLVVFKKAYNENIEEIL